ISSEVSFDSSEVSFHAHVGNAFPPRSDLKISTWRLCHTYHLGEWQKWQNESPQSISKNFPALENKISKGGN
ncbi:hypothetical protein, partial [Porphyromonas sp.]|uniref:hypothetical protein n=1 Tax=Porphyromonas sp. TaxID=1924944 RepID=UPI003993F34A